MDENVIKRIMPNDLAAEQSVIGAMLLDANAISTAADILTGDDFYNKQYGVLFETMLELQGAGAPVDPVTLQAKLKEKDVPPEVSNLEFLIDMRDDAITPVHIKQYATIVYEKSILRKMIRINEEVANSCYAGKENMESILEDAEKRVFQLSQQRNTGEFVPIRQVLIFDHTSSLLFTSSFSFTITIHMPF